MAGTVLVVDEEGMGYAYITFDEPFIEAVGKALPMGVGPEHPAYLRAVCNLRAPGAWSIFIVPFGPESGILLLVYPDTPHWLSTIYRGAK